MDYKKSRTLKEATITHDALQREKVARETKTGSVQWYDDQSNVENSESKAVGISEKSLVDGQTIVKRKLPSTRKGLRKEIRLTCIVSLADG